FKQTLLYLGDFIFKQLPDKFGRGAREQNLLPSCRTVDLGDPGANPVANAQILFGNHFGTRQTRFDLARFNNGVAFVESLDGAGNNGLATIQEIVQHLFSFGIANFLDDGLLGSLGPDTSELDRLERLFKILALLDARLDF